MRNYTSRGFTLAEVLITLAIIGVVAAITIPTLITNYQKKMFASKLKQTYSMLANMHLMDLQIDEGNRNWCSSIDKIDVSQVNDNGKELMISTAEKHILPYLKVAKNYGFTSLKAVKYPVDYKCLNEDICNPSSETGTTYYIMELVNNVTLFYKISSNIDNTFSLPMIYIDVNGRSGPNVVGKDLFVVQLQDNGVINMFNYGYGRDTLLQLCSKTSSESRFCGALVKIDGWEFKEDYPW